MRKTSQEGKIDEIDSAKSKSSVQEESNVRRSRGTRDTLNKFEGKENSKDTTNKPTSSPVSYLTDTNMTTVTKLIIAYSSLIPVEGSKMSLFGYLCTSV